MDRRRDIEFLADNTNYKAICCEKIPEIFLDKLVAKKHFSQYGKIKRFILRPKRFSCVVEYERETEAERAFMEGNVYNGHAFIIRFAQHEVAHIQNTEEWVDSEVQAELDAMAGYGQTMHFSNTNIRNTNANTPVSKFSHLGRTNKMQINAASPQMKIAKNTIQLAQSNSPASDSTVLNELIAILKKPAVTDEEKYRCLDARDKILRLTAIKETDIKKAVTMRGTCPDMCPEKERLMREYQRQVSFFEMDHAGNRINHGKAVKEYSRSSADQETPLVHELRPEPVLQRTMLYLMHRIMDLCNDPQTSLPDWFHFVWDRTRSIRKDITQQELCSLVSVELVEQCARFHLHCAARLVAEDPSVFDKKINAENLTKCLQSLKYMYHDLRLKGVHCPREIEFRSYIVLLNLHDSNFLWELRQLPENIQKAPEIRRSIEFYNALQNRNYVKFFAMVKSHQTSYLSACILLGYFNKFRIHAMEIILKSHNANKMMVYLPLTYLTDILGFEDVNAAMNFFSYHGLQYNEQEDRILLERMCKPDVEYSMERALRLVESKRTISVGECVCGNSLQSAELFEQHQPQNSFDQFGYLKSEAWDCCEFLKNFKNTQKMESTAKQISVQNMEANKNDNALFKMPLSTAPISPKQLQLQHKPQQQQNIFTITNPASNEVNWPPSTAAPDFKISGNIFDKTSNSSTASPISFNLSNQILPCNADMGYKPLEIITSSNKSTSGINIFNMKTQQPRKSNDQSPFSSNIFGTPISDSNDSIRALSTIGKPQGSITRAANEQAKLFNWKEHLEKEQVIKQKQLEEEKAKLKELEEQKKKKQEQLLQSKLEDEKRKQHERMKKSIELAAINLFNDLVNAEVGKISQEVWNSYATVTQLAQQNSKALLDQIVGILVEELAHEEYEIMCRNQRLLTKYFKRWLLHLQKKQQHRKLMENTPLWVGTETRQQFADNLFHPSQMVNMGMIKRYRLGEACDFHQLLELDILNYKHHPDAGFLNIFDLLKQHFNSQIEKGDVPLVETRKYFKILLSLPANDEELMGFEALCTKWLIRHIEKAQRSSAPFVLDLQQNLALCIRKLTGVQTLTELGEPLKHEADHSDGIICFISGLSIEKQSHQRMKHLLCNANNSKRIPMAIITYNCKMSSERITKLLKLREFVDEGHLSIYKCFGNDLVQNEFSFRQNLIDGINFIASTSLKDNWKLVKGLEMQSFLQFFDTCLGEELWQRWLESFEKNLVFQKFCTLPDYIIGLFNYTLEKLIQIIQIDLPKMPEFPDDLKELVPEKPINSMRLGLEYFPANWKQASKLRLVIQFLKDIYLPSSFDTAQTEEIESLKLWILKYASFCVIDDDLKAAAAAQQAIKELINQLQVNESLDISTINQYLTRLNYLTVLKPIINARIEQILKCASNELLHSTIIYFRSDLNDYQTQPWWLSYEPPPKHSRIVVDYEDIPTVNDKTVHSPPKSIGDEDETVIKRAEEIALKSEISLNSQYKKSLSACPASAYKIKKNLDLSLYQFEVSKRLGKFDVCQQFAKPAGMESSLKELNVDKNPKFSKRKPLQLPQSCLDTTQLPSDASEEAIVAKAMRLAKQIELLEERKQRLKRMGFLYKENS